MKRVLKLAMMIPVLVMGVTAFADDAPNSSHGLVRCTAQFRIDFSKREFSAVGMSKLSASRRAMDRCEQARKLITSPLASQCTIVSCYPM